MTEGEKPTGYWTDTKMFNSHYGPCQTADCPFQSLKLYLDSLNSQKPTLSEVKSRVEAAGLEIRHQQTQPPGFRAVCNRRYPDKRECASLAVMQQTLG